MSLHLVRPVSIDPRGVLGPTKGQARGPFWRRSSPGLYVPASVDQHRVEQRILEQAARLPTGGAVGGWAALVLHGIAYVDGLALDGRTELPVPLVVPRGFGIRSAPGFELHRNQDLEDATAVIEGISVTRPARSAFDAARWSTGIRDAVAVLDLAQASGVVTPHELDGYVRLRVGVPGSRRVRDALALTDARTMSPLETALRLIWVLDARLPAPKVNWPVADGEDRFIGRPDLLCEQLGVVGEFDGSTHRSARTQHDDIRRDEAFRSVGLEPFRVVGADLADTPTVLRRIASAIDRANRSTTPRTWQVQASPRPVRLTRAT